MKRIGRIVIIVLGFLFLCLAGKGLYEIGRRLEENSVLRKVIERLSATSRIAEVLVTQSRFDEQTRKIETTIKFLEYDSEGNPLAPKYFTFQGNVIQFQSLVIRFQDKFIRNGDRLRGKSAYLFLRAFALDGKETQSFDIARVDEVPQGYKIPGANGEFEKKIWGEFWKYALDPAARGEMGVKNAQIEAPGSMFMPGTIYTVRIEHDGGMRIDGEPVPEILRGEKI